MPFSLGHVFNSGLRSGDLSDHKTKGTILAPDYSQMKTGYGWQMTAQESVLRTTISDEIYLAYRDGMEHSTILPMITVPINIKTRMALASPLR